MKLRPQAISEEGWKEQCEQVSQALENGHGLFRQHLGIHQNKACLYRWARDCLIPAENNLAERDRRPTMVARKASFGSQSRKGVQTRGILMTVMQTLKKQ